MGLVQSVISFAFSQTGALVTAVLYAAIAEFLAHSPQYDANSPLQAIKNALGWLKGKQESSIPKQG